MEKCYPVQPMGQSKRDNKRTLNKQQKRGHIAAIINRINKQFAAAAVAGIPMFNGRNVSTRVPSGSGDVSVSPQGLPLVWDPRSSMFPCCLLSLVSTEIKNET
eukprot:TRINITY_DN10883_c0_g1_i2.p3 TRINITY_DN10883_c0_g1~~TRINITY_DN10883_c0_g1_i2.p3  ORF type:complete len:103 (-),score=5.36 TRINITY_DN10883_c0_g1_i2:84-392(-)